ncbi:MAG: type II toxin-antitoxin system RelE/ParE family toxin [Candidatus Wildermuthbacteria bacterium]|nr:type II toxin-antitoxin system RelE/ParE family toxin [Candidatus Wildermuthbacteria bacterium]
MEFYFWKSPTGRSPVEEFLLKELDVQNSKKLLQRLELFKEFPNEHLWRSGDLKKFDNELCYLRIRLNKGFCRIFCTIEGQECVLIHAFLKKSDKIHKKEIKTAKERVHSYKSP